MLLPLVEIAGYRRQRHGGGVRRRIPTAFEPLLVVHCELSRATVHLAVVQTLQDLHPPAAPAVGVGVGDELGFIGEPDLEVEQVGQEDVGPEVREEGFAGQAGRVDEHLQEVARGEAAVALHLVHDSEVELRARGEVGVGHPAGVPFLFSGGGGGEGRGVERGDDAEEADRVAQRADLRFSRVRGGIGGGVREALDALDGELEVGQHRVLPPRRRRHRGGEARGALLPERPSELRVS